MERTTLTAIVNEYASHLQVEKGLAKASRERYAGLARSLLAFCSQDPSALYLPADWTFHHLDRRVVETYLNTLKDERGWKPMSTAYYITVLSAFFRFLKSRNHIDVNPCSNLRPRLDGTFEAPPEGDAEAVLTMFSKPAATLEAARCMLLLELMYGAGLRPTQAYGIDAMTADAARGKVVISIQGTGQELALSPEGIARAERYCMLRSAVLAGLAGMDKALPAAAFWIDRRGRPCSAARMARQVSKAMRAAGLAGGPSSLRVLAARHFAQRGGDIRSMQQLLGARRLGQLDRFQPSSDLKELMERFRRAHPRQSTE